MVFLHFCRLALLSNSLQCHTPTVCVAQQFISSDKQNVSGVVCTAPAPNNVQILFSNRCRDRRHDHDKWFYTRPHGGNCDRIPFFEDLFDVDEQDRKDVTTADDIVFVFQFPNPRDGHELLMSRLHQTMLSVFSLSIDFDDSYSSGIYQTDVTPAIFSRSFVA